MKYIITGGPCTGKTTMIDELRKKKFECVLEAPRIIIEHEQKKKKGVLPWTDLKKFQKYVIREQLRLERTIKKTPVFLDRGLPDVLGYSNLANINLGEKILHRIKKANYTKVFFLEQLDIFHTDDVRKESKEEADKIHEAIFEAYENLGFEIIKVPSLPVKERVEFILEKIGMPKVPSKKVK